MKFLGIDPGYARLGYGLIQVNGNRAEFVDAGVFETSPKQSEGERLFKLQEFLQQLLKGGFFVLPCNTCILREAASGFLQAEASVKIVPAR